ncbi:Hypothetical predicted protein [Olea europaea subsp. europaea]|uniref:Uncharacterized protein n=1 Tax=Olea europaea subsp. europaea TaxID=158383 RepID=A0A8S0UV44_OLEEU|nr:Hypothetical predicted protein [Olea europaea subsp. europaea]
MATNKEHRKLLKRDLKLVRDSLKNFRVEMQVQIRGVQEKLVEIMNFLVGMKASMEQSSFHTSKKGSMFKESKYNSQMGKIDFPRFSCDDSIKCLNKWLNHTISTHNRYY